jgi:hypothetical protein
MAQAPLLHLLKAEHLPSTTSAITSGTTAELAEALAAVRTGTPAGRATALARLGPPEPPIGYTAEDRAALPEDRYEEHDEFFRAVRVGAIRPVHAFTRTMVEALDRHLADLHEAGTWLSAEEQHDITAGFHAVFDLVAGHPAPASPHGSGVGRKPGDGHAQPVDPMLRWKLGHQVFFAQIQGLVVLLNCFADALERSDPAAPGLLDTATTVMRASAGALRYAGDFSPTAYAGVVRPGMMPPHLEPKFSGLQVRDHRVLLAVMGRLKPALLAAAEPVREAHARFLGEMTITYEAHKFVCARFGGDREPSLRMTGGAPASAADVLERFKTSRRRIAGG